MTVEQAEVQETAQETTEPLTQEQAQTEIARLQGDPDFLKTYLSRGNDDSGAHKESVTRMTKLFEMAHPKQPVSDTPRLDEMVAERDQQRQQGQQPLSDREQAEAETKVLDDAQQVMQDRFGADWQEEMSVVRESIQELCSAAAQHL